MGVDTRRPPLPAPTDVSSADNGSAIADDLATDISRRTDRTSYSIPEDGSPITLTTDKVRSKKEGLGHGRNKSQTSLLIEYFEGGKSGDKTHSRPSVRVRVTPSSGRKQKVGSDQIQITQVGKDRKPSYTRRISLGTPNREQKPALPEGTEVSVSSESNLSGRPPVEIEVLENVSELSRSELSAGRYIPAPSDISSMPPDSMLEGEATIQSPPRPRSRSLERDEVMSPDHLKAPSRRRSRSLSRERITQKVMEKLASQQVDPPVKQKKTRSRESSISKDRLPEAERSSRRRSSRSERSEDIVPGAESSLLTSNISRRSGDAQSIRSGTSAASSINNPKLLQTVEDAIRRLIIPELNALKEQQKTQENRSTFERTARDSIATTATADSREDVRRRVSKTGSAPNLSGKPKVVLNRSGDDPGLTLSGDSIKGKKVRRTSRGSTERSASYGLDDSLDTVIRDDEKVHRKKSKDRHALKEAAAVGAAAGLTAAALRHHDSISSTDTRDTRERRKKRSKSKSRSRTASISDLPEDWNKEDIPPMPMQSEIPSDVTRESILTAETERPVSRSSRGGSSTPVRDPILREVNRGTPREVLSPAPRTPNRTPLGSAAARGLYSQGNRSQGEISLPRSAKSDRSISTKARHAALAAAGLGGLGPPTTYHKATVQDPISKDIDEHTDQYGHGQHSPTREVSPVQSIASYMEGDDPGHMAVPRSAKSVASLSSAGRAASRQRSNLSIDSLESSPGTKVARSRRRPQGVNLERKSDILEHDHLQDSELAYESGTRTPKDVGEFFEREHEVNEQYRSDLGYDSQHDSSLLDDKHFSRYTQYTNTSMDMPVTAENDIRGVGANPEYVRTPVAVESAVASLHEPSTLSVRSSGSGPSKQSFGSQPSGFRENQDVLAEDRSISGSETPHQGYEHPSQERWHAIRDQAKALSSASPQNRTVTAASQDRPVTASPQQSVSRTVSEKSMPRMGASAFPGQDDYMPEIGYGLEDDESELTTNPSEIQGPIGAGQNRWVRDPELTPPLSRNMLDEERMYEQPELGTAKAVAVGGAGATAAGIAAAAAARINRDKQPETYQPTRGLQPSVKDEHDDDDTPERSFHQDSYAARENVTPTSAPGHWKDEGYISAPHPGGITPEPYQQPLMPNAPKLFDEEAENEFDADPFVGKNRGHVRQVSGNSHGMGSPIYDSATGKGIDRIQSKDVVALMDHLTVRDAQRNARDTEILVTLVRSAAEMRNSFEEMKRFIAEQDRLIMSNTDRDAEMTVQKVLGGPRPQPLSSPRVPRQRSTEDAEDLPTKRKNVFKRALKGLSMRSSNDLANIEGMLMQLLDEVEGLKEIQDVQRTSLEPSHSLDSYEKMRAADTGYEPEGQAGTSSTPGQSGYFSNTSSRQVNGMHSGYDGRRASDSGHRISTVLERDEENDDYDQATPPANQDYGNEERLLTPTQEVRRDRSVSQETPPQPAAAYVSPESPERSSKKKHKSGSSSLFGFPKISRWSKTTSSTAQETTPRMSGSRKERPSSEASRSGSNVNLANNYYDYEVPDDDRLRSNASLAAQQQAQVSADLANARSPSPLIPESPTDDPKYQAHRNSLNLMHPQPRQGPTHRHQTYLESQAHNYEGSPATPDADVYGSAPALALNRNRMSTGTQGTAGNYSPVSEGSYSAHSAAEQAGPPRSSRLRDDGPLVPQQPPRIQEPENRGPPKMMMYSSPPGSGHQLAPIEERYSMEGDSARLLTPSPQPNQSMQSPARRITGPRPMGSRSPSQTNGAPLYGNSGTVRRKPVDQRSLESYRDSFESETF
ncbi:hypothetical protein H2201_006304 [Coniosporium apollinis]|uniref:Transaldolase n=1 Tax=Coniosporium apollinis TaxID=61459 RepID=A0ABQ9NMG5_9PEZI|nr:hypothetical protein H2201_006304 [Coniosporium apollinis]